MRLVLFRHGPAGDRDPVRWPDDSARPLTEKGVARTRSAALGLLALERRLSVVLTSPLARALQTARLLAEAAELDAPIELDALAPGESWRQVLAALARLHEETRLGDDDVVALVGHEPELGKLAGVLLFGAPQSLPMKKAGACAVDFRGVPAAGTGSIRWFLGPRALRQLRRRTLKAGT